MASLVMSSLSSSSLAHPELAPGCGDHWQDALRMSGLGGFDSSLCASSGSIVSYHASANGKNETMTTQCIIATS